MDARRPAASMRPGMGCWRAAGSLREAAGCQAKRKTFWHLRAVQQGAAASIKHPLPNDVCLTSCGEPGHFINPGPRCAEARDGNPGAPSGGQAPDEHSPDGSHPGCMNLPRCFR